MSAMEPSITSRPSVSESVRTSATDIGGTIGGTEKAHGDRHFEPMIVPGLVGTGPILPAWLRKLFRRKAMHV